MLLIKWLGLQIFADGAAGDGGDGGDGGAATVESAPDDGEGRLRELGVPESVLRKRASRAQRRGQAPAPQPQPERQVAAAEPKAQTEPEQTPPEPESKPAMTWDDFMAIPENNERMQSTIKSRLRNANGAVEALQAMQPAIEVLARKHGLDMDNLDYTKLAAAISDDDSMYEDKALELGVSVDVAKQIDQNERETARRQREEQQTIERQRIEQHIEGLKQQGEVLKQTFPNFDLATELRNPAFARMTAPNVGISVEDAYYAVHRREIQSAAMQITQQQTAEKMANAIRSGQSRPVENGTSSQAPSVTTFDYRNASREQREMLKKRIRDAAARGEKIYPGQR